MSAIPFRTLSRLCCALVLALLITACGGSTASDDPADNSDAADAEQGDEDDDATADAQSQDDDTPAGAAVDDMNLQFATYLGPGSVDAQTSEEWASMVADMTDEAVSVEFFFQESLLPATEILSGVAQGRAQMGGMSHGYHPGELPLSHVTNLPFLTQNIPAQINALRDLYEDDPAYQQEWESNGVRPLWFSVLTPAVLGCTEPIDSVDDLQGRRVRAAALVANVFESLGAEVIALPAPETYESAQRGLIDCWSALSLDIAVDLGLHEVTPHLYDFGYGSFGATEGVISLDVWESLSDEAQGVFSDAANEIFERFPEITAERIDVACQTLIDAGLGVEVLPDDVLDALEDAVGDSAVEAYLGITETAGVDGQAFLDRYRESIESYEAEFTDYEPPLAACARETAE